MRVGIDARFLTHPQRGGFKTYTQTLVTALADSGDEYILYTDRQSELPEPLPANFIVKPAESRNAIIREQVVLPMLMRRDGLDIAHFPCNTAPILYRGGMVTTIHDAIALRNTRKRTGAKGLKHQLLDTYWRMVIPAAARRSRLIITNSRFSERDLVETLSLPESKFRIVPIAVSKVFSGVVNGEPPDDVIPGDRFILAFAAMDGRKNHTSVITAFRQVRGSFPDVKLVLVCSHPSMREVLRSSGEGVLPVGPVSMEELVWLYRNAQFLVFPSLNEGYGLPPLEAMSCGLPVAASSSGSLSEVLGGHMLPVDPTDSESITLGIRRLLQDEALRARLRDEGLRHTSDYTSDRMGRAIAAVYREATSQS